MKIIVSAVNLVDGGAVEILKETLVASRRIKEKNSNVSFTFLLANESVCRDFQYDFDFYFFPECKKSWFSRINFEYIRSKKISDSLNADLWISLHDISANVNCDQVVYCHNPSPFLSMPFKDIAIDFKQYLFSKFYKYLYRIGIYKNKYVIVQQRWIKDEFERSFPGIDVLVSRPEGHTAKPQSIDDENGNISCKNSSEKLFFYPAYPRYFKNQMLLVKCARAIESKYPHVKFILTIDGSENKYANMVVTEASGLSNVFFTGLISKAEVEEYYKSATALIFPSKLETWGLPITEFSHYNKPIILPELKYALETSSGIPDCFFFQPDSTDSLIKAIDKVLSGENCKPNYFSSEKNNDKVLEGGMLNLLDYLIKDNA